MRCRCSFSRRSTWPWARRSPPLSGGSVGRTREIGFATALVFPCVGRRRGGRRHRHARHARAAGRASCSSLWPGSCCAAVPVIAILRSWHDRGLLVTGARRAREAEERTLLRDRELAGVDRLSHQLLDADDPVEIARGPADELVDLFAARCREPRARRGRAAAPRASSPRATAATRQRAAARPVDLARATRRPASAPSSARVPPSRSTTPRAPRS